MQQGFTRKPRVLIVGAGAVGQVFGQHLADGGAVVTYLVKPKYQKKTSEGLILHRITLGGGYRKYRTFVPEEVYGSPEETAGNLFDQVILCVSSPALRGDWLPRLEPYIGEAPVVSMTPGLEDRHYLETIFPPARIVTGMIGFIAYQCPLPGEELFPPGVAYFLPPMSPCIFEGPQAAALKPVELLQKGGIKAAYRKDGRGQLFLASSLMMPTIVGLEIEDWSIDRFLNSQTMEASLLASKEIASAVEQHFGVKRGWLRKKITKPGIFKFLGGLAPTLSPLPLETYVKYHFSKVHEQTETTMAKFLDLGSQTGSEMVATRFLHSNWQKALTAGVVPQIGGAAAQPRADDSAVLAIPGDGAGLDEETEPPQFE